MYDFQGSMRNIIVGFLNGVGRVTYERTRHDTSAERTLLLVFFSDANLTIIIFTTL